MKSAHRELFPSRILGLGIPALISSRVGKASARPCHHGVGENKLPLSGEKEPSVPVILGGTRVDLMSFENAVETVMSRACQGGSKPLGVLSANLDHITNFGTGSTWAGTFEGDRTIDWLTLLDGAPLVDRANKVTQERWPRVAGSDLVEPILDRAADQGLTVGFLGGSAEAHALVKERFERDRPNLRVGGMWAPERSSLEDAEACRALCGEMAKARIHILIVCLGKPLQELWIARYGASTRANVLLGFGAVVNFLAGQVTRAPQAIRRLGLEWGWRLVLEPRRLARRYLIQGPAAYRQLLHHSCSSYERSADAPPTTAAQSVVQLTPGRFADRSAHTDVAVLVVTYNNERDLPGLIQSLRQETADQSIKVVVADNSPTAQTLRALAGEADVFSFSTGGNRGYSGGINAAMEQAGPADSYLILNPDVRLEAGSIKALRTRMHVSDSAVVVPMLLDEHGGVYHSLRREPSVLRSAGDALLGSRMSQRSGRFSEMVVDRNSYSFPHTVDWATGAALLIRADLAAEIGPWDEQFFLYSEEVDFFRRARDVGASAWFEPESKMVHRQGGSGFSTELQSLMAVNRVRYARKHRSRANAALMRGIVAAGELARAGRPGHWQTFLTLLDLRTWGELPSASWYPAGSAHGKALLSGSIIIPAHNEAAVIGRTLKMLEPCLLEGTVEVIVACNGCTDGTDEVAESFPGVSVIRIPEASKIAALNAGDRAATQWPRIYLDADIDLPATALVHTLTELASETGPLAARPPFRYDTDGASWSVRAYFRARSRMCGASTALWGAGVFGLSQRGRDRFLEFPAVTADDLYVDSLFSADEKSVLVCKPVRVRTPRSSSALRHTLGRVYRGNAEQRREDGMAVLRTFRDLLSSIRGPISAVEVVVYAAYAVSGRWHSKNRSMTHWERDDSSRMPRPHNRFAGGWGS